MITLTDKAQTKIKEISDADNIGHYCIRVKILAGGCSGFTHDIMFDDKIFETDEVIEFMPIKIVIDELAYQYLQNITIDYQEGLIESGFKIISPDITGSCGCGQSVSY